MRTPNRVMPALLTAATLASAMVLAGCTPDEPDSPAQTPTPTSASPTAAAASPSPSPEESAAPEYSAEETTAIEQAKAAVARFYEVTNTVFSDPENAGSKPFLSVAIDPVRSDRRSVLGSFIEEGTHQTGSMAVEFAEVRSVSAESDPEQFVYPKVMFDICVDVSDTDVVDSSGKSIVEERKYDRQTAVIGAYEEPGEGWFVDHLDYTVDEGDACEQ